MTVYVQEPIDVDDLKTIIDDNWDVRSNTDIPAPTVHTSEQAYHDPSVAFVDGAQASVNVWVETIDEVQSGFAYQNVTRTATCRIDIRSRREIAANGGTGRQYLHDLKQELRRIIYANRHSLTNWQVMRYLSFKEIEDQSYGSSHAGQITVRLENESECVEAELLAEDLFTRADAAIGGDWTAVTGTWETVINRAALQSATANAKATFAPSGVTLKSNTSVRCDVITAASMDAGVLFRYTDSNNHWRAVITDGGGAARHLELRLVLAGTETTPVTIISPESGWTDGDRVELSVNLSGTMIEIEWNGAVVARFRSTSHQTATGVGLYSDSDQITRFDNFRIFERGGSAR